MSCGHCDQTTNWSVHGNEYEGQVALRRIVADVQPAQLYGRLIIVPTISLEASAGWSREWPDGTNFNRVMPGNPRGIPAEQLAHFLNRLGALDRKVLEAARDRELLSPETRAALLHPSEAAVATPQEAAL